MGFYNKIIDKNDFKYSKSYVSFRDNQVYNDSLKQVSLFCSVI